MSLILSWLILHINTCCRSLYGALLGSKSLLLCVASPTLGGFPWTLMWSSLTLTSQVGRLYNVLSSVCRACGYVPISNKLTPCSLVDSATDILWIPILPLMDKRMLSISTLMHLALLIFWCNTECNDYLLSLTLGSSQIASFRTKIPK